MKKKIVLSMVACAFLFTSQIKAQSYFAAELTTKGVYTYVKMPEGTKDIQGELIKGKATAITEAQFNALITGKKTTAIVINGIKHQPDPKVLKMDGEWKWCSYETPSGGISWYTCKVPKDGSDCCTMTITITPSKPVTADKL